MQVSQVVTPSAGSSQASSETLLGQGTHPCLLIVSLENLLFQVLPLE